MGNSLMEKTMDKDGCNIHYWVSNNVKGPWLVFLHGLSRPMGDKFSIKLLVEDLIENT